MISTQVHSKHNFVFRFVVVGHRKRGCTSASVKYTNRRIFSILWQRVVTETDDETKGSATKAALLLRNSA